MVQNIILRPLYFFIGFLVISSFFQKPKVYSDVGVYQTASDTTVVNHDVVSSPLVVRP